MSPIPVLRRMHIPKMGNGYNGNVGRDNGVRDASLPGHNSHTNGQDRSRGQRAERGPSENLSDARDTGTKFQQIRLGHAQRQRRPVRLGREDTGRSAVSFLLRIHNHTLAGRRFVAKIRR